MNEDRLVEEHVRESPANTPHFFWEVVVPVAVSATGTYLIVAVAFGVPAGQGAAGLIMLLVLGWRLVQWDRHGRGVHVVERRVYREPDATRREWSIAVQDNGEAGNGGHRLRIGGWPFSESEAARLAEAFSHGAITRTGLEGVLKDNGHRYFANTSDRYQEYVAEFRRLGFIDDDNVPTAVARAWFEGRGHPLPPADV